MPSYLITGAGRGIGLGLVKAILEKPDTFVIAAARKPENSKELQDLLAKYGAARFATVVLDKANQANILEAARTAAELLPNGLDYLINNGAANEQPHKSFDEIDRDVFAHELLVNTIAPLEIIRAFLPLLRKGTEKKIMLMISVLASIEYAPVLDVACVSYSVTKAGLSMLARKWAPTLSEEGIAIVLMNPGWVDTELGHTMDDYIESHRDMYPDENPIPVEESVAGCLKVMMEVKCDKAIKAWTYKGQILPW
ncbi:uncharacterized protein FIBRA_07276 [Fibroporia radiculosa]|uniref:NAD(P)-binding protein n=1 Tax=Fibroporia radiculosa TaxID=599839 RepID=J4GUM2_9APHY|nr:uncharacterized protein FIBRA_07276 [Fibroporia radiculosa]CCM05070.1 predicted protein [Fibroporia radiculosa]